MLFRTAKSTQKTHQRERAIFARHYLGFSEWCCSIEKSFGMTGGKDIFYFFLSTRTDVQQLKNVLASGHNLEIILPKRLYLVRKILNNKLKKKKRLHNIFQKFDGFIAWKLDVRVHSVGILDVHSVGILDGLNI